MGYELEGKDAAQWREEADASKRRTALLGTPPETTEWHNDLVVGQRVRYTRSGGWGTATGGGVYLGVALDEEDGVSYHYFVRGEINGRYQSSHGFPAAAGTPVTTDLTPTDLIRKATR